MAWALRSKTAFLSLLVLQASPVFALRGESGSPVVRGGLEQILLFDQEGAGLLGFDSAARREQGQRSAQQDDYLLVTLGKPGAAPAGILSIVADGMGGLAAGDLASRMAVVRISEELKGSADLADLLKWHDLAEGTDDQRRLQRLIQTQIFLAVDRANLEILKVGELLWQYRNPAGPPDKAELERQIRSRTDRFGVTVDLADPKISPASLPGSTVVLMVATQRTAFVAWMGDSRIYRHSATDGLARLTVDDRSKPNVLTRHLGMGGTDLHQEMVSLENGDRLLLVTDGVTDLLGDPLIGEHLVSAPTVADAADRILSAARYGSDNRTAILLQARKAPVRDVRRAIQLVSELKLKEVPEPRMAVLSFEAVSIHPQLQGLAGRLLRMGNTWLFILPEKTRKMGDILQPLLELRSPPKAWEYGEPSDRGLDLFEWHAKPMNIQIVSARQPLRGAGFQELLRRILADLRGPQVQPASPEDLQRMEELLALFV